MSSEVLETPPKKSKEVSHRLDFRHAIKGSMYPQMAQYQLRAAAILGAEIPSFQCPNAQGAAPMRAVVSIGVHRLEFAYRPNVKGRVTWNATLTAKNLDFPNDLTQLPDLIVYLVRGGLATEAGLGGGTTVAYARVPAARLIAEQVRSE